MQNDPTLSIQMTQNFLNLSSTREKVSRAEEVCHYLLRGESLLIPEVPARDLRVCSPAQLPGKKGFSQKEAQARLLHDLASIELQAFELALRTLSEFPEAGQGFREQLADIAIDESRHLKACLDSIESLGYSWGDWPVHCALWEATSPDNNLLERILIVHRYLEGSGLDAGDTLLRKLHSTPIEKSVDQTIRMIVAEEMGHVQFGSRWYRHFCRKLSIDEQSLFKKQMGLIYKKIPRREKINREVRKQAGFTDFEIDVLETQRASIIY